MNVLFHFYFRLLTLQPKYFLIIIDRSIGTYFSIANYISILDWYKHSPMIVSKLKLIYDGINLALAKYELVKHPREPLRLTKISALLNSLESVATPQQILLYCFKNNVTIVPNVINYTFMSL